MNNHRADLDYSKVLINYYLHSFVAFRKCWIVRNVTEFLICKSSNILLIRLSSNSPAVGVMFPKTQSLINSLKLLLFKRNTIV